MWELLPIVFSLGVLNRIADMIADEGLRLSRLIGYPLSIAYGFLIAYVITAYPVLAELGVAILLSVILTGKIDHPTHYMGIGSMIFFVAIMGISPLNPALLILFILGAAIDEAGNNLADDKKVKGVAGKFFRLRLTMEVLTLAISLATGLWAFFIAMLAYDAGFSYVFPDRVRRKLISVCG